MGSEAGRESSVERVHVVFKTHLDIGFTDLAERVKERYLSVFFPKALRTARELREAGGPERLVWTTGSWLVDEYLRRASGSALQEAEQAIHDGTIAWHALPVTTHTELMDVPLGEFALSIAARLDARFGRKTIAAKLTDVPGHTLGLVPLLARAGVRYLHVGVNGTSQLPEVSRLFRWVAPAGEEVIVHYSEGYGDSVAVEGLHDALALVHSSDNDGPPSASQVRAAFEDLRQRYPGARLEASTLDRFAGQLLQVSDRLPRVCEEIGDTWIHGVASDPRKVAHYRELLRLRDRWVREGRLSTASEAFREFSTNLLLICEHTWGLDFKKYLGDYRSWSLEAFQAARREDRVGQLAVPEQYRFIEEGARKELESLFPGERRWEARSYSFFESSHAEQRAYVSKAVAALPLELRREADQALAALTPVAPVSPSVLDAPDAPDAPVAPRVEPGPRTESLEPGEPIRLGGMSVRFAADGSIGSMTRASKHSEARPELVCRQTGFGEFRYQTFGPEEYAAWHRDYNRNLEQNAWWAYADFGKPGLEHAQPRPRASLVSPLVRRVAVRRMADRDEAIVETILAGADEPGGAPRRVVLRYGFFKEPADQIEVTVDWFEKAATRLPEALWLSFGLAVENPNRWKLVKLGLPLSPLDVVRGGNRAYHAVEEVRYDGADGSCSLRPLDSPLVSPGERKLLRFDGSCGDLEGGMHFCLYDNLWGTNFPAWYGEDARFRFMISLAGWRSSGR